MNDVVIIIPSYNPDSKLINLVNDLIKNKFSKIIIVNDGSNKGIKIFNILKEKEECILLEYKVNKGKGYALKYGISYYLEKFKSTHKGIVLCDSDYQHHPDDILNIANTLLNNQDSLILGNRDFNEKGIPNTSKYGNKITSSLFKLLYGKKIIDTQTGLRGIPNRYLHLCLESSGKRFDCEMNMLIKFTREKINIIEVPIKTIYHKNHKSTFNKVIDSIMIYKVLFTEYIKFTLSSLTCYSVDIVLFNVFMLLFNTINNNIAIVMSTLFARIIADFLNFNINKNIVFQSHENGKTIYLKYYLLSFSKMFASALFVLILTNLFQGSETVFKMIVDSIIYVISYKIQKKYIFRT